MAFGEPRLVRPKDERHMREDGQRRAERLVLQDLLRRVGDVVRAADDMGEAHVEVVGNDG